MPGENSETYPEVEIARCSGCGRCVAACPQRLFSLEVTGFRKHAHLREPERCTRCRRCLVACPVKVLSCADTREPLSDGDD